MLALRLVCTENEALLLVRTTREACIEQSRKTRRNNDAFGLIFIATLLLWMFLCLHSRIIAMNWKQHQIRCAWLTRNEHDKMFGCFISPILFFSSSIDGESGGTAIEEIKVSAYHGKESRMLVSYFFFFLPFVLLLLFSTPPRNACPFAFTRNFFPFYWRAKVVFFMWRKMRHNKVNSEKTVDAN